jgi:ribosome-interacting GTPase 1
LEWGGLEAEMPTNLPPEYFDAEERFREAKSPGEKIERLEELIRTVPKHKGTDKLRADLRRKLSKLKDSAQAKKKVSKRESVFSIDKEGAGQVAVVGPANVGKSALVAALTNAEPEVAPYPCSTWVPTPGMMQVENIQIQLIDTPPLDREHVEPQLVDLIRRSDLLLLVVDLQGFPIEQLQGTLAFLEDHRILPGGAGEPGADSRRATLKPMLLLVNKCDDERCQEDFEVFCELLEGDWSPIPLSATSGRNLDRLRWAVFEALEVIRVYSKPPGRDADFSAPFVLPAGSTVEQFAGRVHNDFLKSMKTARLWGEGVHDGQLVGRDHVLHDGDVVELRT